MSPTLHFDGSHLLRWRLQPRHQEKAEAQKESVEGLGKIGNGEVSSATKAETTHTLALPNTDTESDRED